MDSSQGSLSGEIGGVTGLSASFTLGIVAPPGRAGLDADWHLVALSLAADSVTVNGFFDANEIFQGYVNSDPLQPNAAGLVDLIGASSASAGFQTAGNWLGHLAFACEIPYVITSTQWRNLWNSWRNAWAASPGNNETSDGRYRRILGWLAYTGPAQISVGASKAYGPAVDISPSGTSVSYALQGLQNVVDTEGGQHFIGAEGAVVFQSRNDRYNKTPTLTFGEHTDAGEIPYLGDVGFDYDPTRVGNDAQVTAQYGSSLYRAQDGPPSDPATSQGKYGTISLRRTVNSLDPFELTAAAQALLYLNKDPQLRLKSVTVDPSSYPAAWPALLGLELGACVKVWRRPATAPAISLTGFVEQITWSRAARTKKTLCTLQISSNARKQVGQFNTSVYQPDAGSMTLQAAITAAATTLTIITAAGSPVASIAPGAYPVNIQVDNEILTLTAAPSSATSPQTFTGVTRGAASTTAAAHTANAIISAATVARWAY